MKTSAVWFLTVTKNFKCHIQFGFKKISRSVIFWLDRSCVLSGASEKARRKSKLELQLVRVQKSSWSVIFWLVRTPVLSGASEKARRKSKSKLQLVRVQKSSWFVIFWIVRTSPNGRFGEGSEEVSPR